MFEIAKDKHIRLFKKLRDRVGDSKAYGNKLGYSVYDRAREDFEWCMDMINYVEDGTFTVRRPDMIKANKLWKQYEKQ